MSMFVVIWSLYDLENCYAARRSFSSSWFSLAEHSSGLHFLRIRITRSNTLAIWHLCSLVKITTYTDLREWGIVETPPLRLIRPSWVDDPWSLSRSEFLSSTLHAFTTRPLQLRNCVIGAWIVLPLMIVIPPAYCNNGPRSNRDRSTETGAIIESFVHWCRGTHLRHSLVHHDSARM